MDPLQNVRQSWLRVESAAFRDAMTVSAKVEPATAVPRRPLTLHNSGWWFAAFLAFTVFAFWPSYFGKLPRGTGDVYTHLHSVLMTVWFGMLIAQPFLARGNKRPIHRQLGRLSYALVPAIAISWALLVNFRARSLPDEVFERDGKFFYLPFVASVLFLIAWGMAILRRRVTPLHARYMVCTAFTLVDPVVARILGFRFPPLENPLAYQWIGYGMTELLIAILYLADRGPHRKAFLHMFIVFTIAHLFWFTGAQTAWWLEIVRWYRSLPLT
jgi:hypothetical protein